MTGPAPTSSERDAATAKHFQDTAKSWSDRYTEGHALSPKFLVRRTAVAAELVRLAGKERLGRAIDLGCGTGPFLPILSRLAREVVGIDIAPAMIEEARSHMPAGTSGVELVCGSVLDIPFPDQHFDLGVCVGVLEYFEDPVQLLRAAFRVMKPGAPIVFTLPNATGVGRLSGLPRTVPLLLPPRWKVRLGAFLNRLRGREPDPSKYYLGACYTRPQLRGLFERAGLKVVGIRSSGYDSWRVAGIPIPSRMDSQLGNALESQRDTFPWRHLGNNLLITACRT
jgi:2-polyprenyl-3-methyl-5-hydroxy-6-metoxy-1,4-benzoquinol methylase